MKRLILTHDEFVDLIHNCRSVTAQFGPRGAWLEYDETQPPSEEVERLLLLRGITNENLEGAGI